MQTGAGAADDLVLREFSQEGRACGTTGKPVNSPVISTPRTVAMANARSAEIAWRECPAWVDTAGVPTRAGSSWYARRLVPVAARAFRSVRKGPHRCVTMFG